MNLKNEIKIILYITMVAVLITCILMFGLNEVWSFHDAVVTSNNRTSEDIHQSDTAKLLSNFPSHDRKDNIITELHSEPENTLSSITQLLLKNPGVIPGGAIDLEANAINNIIHPKDSLNTYNKTATAKGYVINSPRKTTSPSVNSALSLNIVDEGIDLKQGNDNTLRKTQRSDGSVNHFRSDPTHNVIATERNDFYIGNAKETDFHNLLKTGKTDQGFRSTKRALKDDKIQFKVRTAKITPIPNQVRLMTTQTRYEITTKSTQNNSEIDGIVEHAITNSFHRTDIRDKDDTISDKSIIDTHHLNIDDLLKYRKLTSAVPLNVARLQRLTRVDSRNLTQYNKLTSSIPVISTVTKTFPRREIKQEHSYSDGHKHNKNNVSTLKETRDNYNVTGKEKIESSKLSTRKHKNHTEVSHIQNKVMDRKIIKDSRMNKTIMLPQGSESKNSILDKIETNVSKIQRLSPSLKTEKSKTNKALLDTSVVTSKKRKRRRRKYKNGTRQNYLKNDNYKASNKTDHVTKENTTSEYNLTSETIHKHISKPKLLSSDHSNRNFTKMFELEKKPIKRQKVNISKGSKIDKENVTRKPVPVSKRIGKIVSLHFNQSKLEVTSKNSDNKTVIISTTHQPMIIGSINKQTDMANKRLNVKTEQAKIQKHDLENKDVNGNENKDMNRNENKDINRNATAIRINQSKLEITSQNSDNKTIIISTTQQPMIIGSTHKQTDMANKSFNVTTEQARVQKHDLKNKDVNGNENKGMNGNENIDINEYGNKDMNGNENKDMNGNINKDMNENENKNMNGNATAIRVTKRNMNDTKRNNHNDTANDSNKTNILAKLLEVQVTGIPIPFRRYSKLTTPSYRTTTVFTAEETNKEPVSMSQSVFSTPFPAAASNYDINERNKTANLENIEIHDNKNDNMPTGDQRDWNNIRNDNFNRLELLSTNTTVKAHAQDIPQSNGPNSTHSNDSSKIIDKELFFVDNTDQGNPWDRWLGSLPTNDKYPLKIEPKFENKTEIVIPVKNTTVIHNKRESNLTFTSNTPDFTSSPEMHSDVSNKYETTTEENIDTFNNLDYHSFVGKSEVVADKQSTNVSKISDSTSKSQENLLTKWNALLQQFRKDNARKKSKLVQLLQNKSQSKNLKERHDVRFQKKPTSKSKYVKPTVEWLGIYKDLIKEQDKNIIPVSNKQLHHSSHSSLHDGNVHSQFVEEQLKTSCKEDQSYKLALNVLQTILMNMNNIKPPVPKKAHKRRYLLIPLGPENPEPTQRWTENEYTKPRPNNLREERNIYPSDGRIPYRIRPKNPSVHMSVHSSF